MTFGTPLLLALAPLIAVAYLVRWSASGRRAAAPASDLGAFAAAAAGGAGWRVRLRWLPGLLRGLAILALVVAIARPQRGIAVTLQPEQGIDIVVSLDMSGSMLQGTGRGGPTKLQAARTVVDEFVRSLTANRVGLVIFQSRSLVMSPLTLDRDALRATVRSLDTGLLPDGTAIGLGLADSLNLLRESDARSRVVVLLTDGQNNAGEIEPLQASQLAKALGVRVYTVGFVAQRGADVDEATLRRMATDTGGAYYDASTQEELAKAYRTIADLEQSRIGERHFTTYYEYAPWVIGGALALLGLEALLRATVLRRFP